MEFDKAPIIVKKIKKGAGGGAAPAADGLAACTFQIVEVRWL